MLSIAIMIFIIASIFGLIILSSVLNNQPTPKIFVYWHGPIALLGLTLILTAIYYGYRNPIIMAIALLFIIAAIGGSTLFIMDMLKKPLPKWLAIAHPIIAVIAIILLTIYVFHWKRDTTSMYAEIHQLNLKL